MRYHIEKNTVRGISPNADYETVLKQQAEETSYVSEIIQGKKEASEIVEDVIQKGDKLLSGLERKSAEQFINEIRRGFRDGTIDKEADDYPAKQFAHIFAARVLSHSVRNKRDSLAEEFNRNDLDAVTQKLIDNEQFRDFINETYLGEDGEGNEKLNDATRRLFNSRTHGGFIEDEFRQYLLKRPAGELENAPELEKFMPTAGERIE